jgi:hypothetical protein
MNVFFFIIIYITMVIVACQPRNPVTGVTGLACNSNNFQENKGILFCIVILL